MALAALGLFVFKLKTAPIDTIKRTTAQRWEAKNRVGQGPAWQWVGPGEDTITLDGTLVAGLTGGAGNVDKLREMAAGGKAWILTLGTGDVAGQWFIKSVEETRSNLIGNGQPRKITFSLTLERYWDEDAGKLGKLMDSLP